MERAFLATPLVAWFAVANLTSVQIIANPAITIGRLFSDSFAGIGPSSAPGFIAAQIVGALIGLGLTVVLYPQAARIADEVVVPHHRAESSTTAVEQWSSP